MGSKRLTELPDAYLELHIEQGPVLAGLGEPLGVVTAIAGQARAAVTFEGRADHAGTTPMAMRDDALVEAAEFILHVRAAPAGAAVATVGAIEVEPNAVNVVPARVTVSVDARAPTARELDELIEAIGFTPTVRIDPAAMCGRVRRRPAGRAPARLRRRARRDGARRGRRTVVDALRALAERRRLATIPTSSRARRTSRSRSMLSSAALDRLAR